MFTIEYFKRYTSLIRWAQPF